MFYSVQYNQPWHLNGNSKITSVTFDLLLLLMLMIHKCKEMYIVMCLLGLILALFVLHTEMLFIVILTIRSSL